MNQQLTTKELMAATIKPVLNLLQNRLNNRTKALTAIAYNGIDKVPEEVLKMREEEAQIARAVMQEQLDLIEIIKAMYPDA